MKKTIIVLLCALTAGVLVTGCGSSGKSSGTDSKTSSETDTETDITYKDGTYEGKSQIYESEEEDAEDEGGYGVVTLTIKDNAVTECEFLTYTPDGTLKDENYGKQEGDSAAIKALYNKAQKAVASCAEYAGQLVSDGTLDGIDAISGATLNCDMFKDAVTDALDKAK